MRALTLAYKFPYPPRDGYDLRVWNILRELSSGVEQTLVCRTPERPGEAAESLLGRYTIRSRVYVEPRPGPTRRVFKALRFLGAPWPLMAAGWEFAAVRALLRDELSAARPDFAIVEGSWLCPYWADLAGSGARRVLVLHNIEEEVLARRAGGVQGLRRAFFEFERRRMQRVERAMIRSADLVLVTSEREQQVLRDRDPRSQAAVIPNGVDCAALQPLPPAPGTDLLFVGSMNNFPNADGAVWFVGEVLPLVRRRLPGVTLRIVGRDPGPAVRALAGPGVEVTGEVSDLEPHYRRATVCVVPIRTGGGTRLKVLEAMAWGRPLVATSLGCEGIRLEEGVNVRRADEPEKMAGAILDLLQHPAEAARLAAAARRRVEEEYAWPNIAARMCAELRRVQQSGGHPDA